MLTKTNPTNQLRLPQFGLTMTEALIAEWAVCVGQSVAIGDLLYVTETDKIANEVIADRTGVIETILVAQGETVPVGSPLATWRSDGSSISDAEQQPPAESAPTQTTPAPIEATAAPVAAPLLASAITGSERIIATPHARKLARERGVDLKSIIGSGPKGRIKAVDVRTADPATESIQAAVPTGSAANMRRIIARRMTESKQQIPHFYLTANAEISELLWLHEGMKNNPELGRLTLTHWIATAVSLALASDGLFRTIYHQNEWLELTEADVGIAVATDSGLYAPVARNLDYGVLGDNAAQINQLIDRCRADDQPTDSLRGGATTVSNLGNYQVAQIFPIINPGQSSILGVGRTQELFRPDDQGAPKLCKELHLVLACDHRVFNGADGARFLETICNYLQQPMLIVAKPRN
ncbi:MAG: 2-oxo acid dehydrogenase subunit E2 [Gammaproteobacteria bacterium]|nr:MAG: 2-oxo acid dehydrogenase subunit E2 [Gammaproteobacteria bacterium]RLA15375.1 MAG: 2-oxo acid dehydrogenase subunit E2 [Gammaproteobacteria bacterium]